MIEKTGWMVLALLGGAASAASLPLRPGTYVMADSSCRDAAMAAMFEYDGRSFSYPHATRCTSTITAHVGHVYHLSETCLAQGDGSAAAPDTTQATYTVLSSTRVRISHGAGAMSSSYRWCGTSAKR